ncbi:hypothetical protein QBC39DRAFT_436071 [Podospora conica]|nr:hypothetical protein QBC39DRAFT_436071 [Schizothecium conicum]
MGEPLQIKEAFRLLTTGLTDSRKMLSLAKYLGVYIGSEVDTAKYLAPKQWLDTTTVDACLKLFAKPYTGVVVTLPTRIQAHTADNFQNPGIPAGLLAEVNIYMTREGGKDLRAVIWPFLITQDNHFILCVITPDFKATIYDSLGQEHGKKYVQGVEDVLAATQAWKAWKVAPKTSAVQDNGFDSGVYCIANAASVIAERTLPKSINAQFWRIACWSAMGLSSTDEYLATSAFFNTLHGCPEDAVRMAVRAANDDEGLAVLRTLANGPPVKWWSLWERKMARFVQAFEELNAATSAWRANPRFTTKSGLLKLEDEFIEMIGDVEEMEGCMRALGKSRLDLAIHMAGGERLASIVSRMEQLDSVVPVILSIMAG